MYLYFFPTKLTTDNWKIKDYIKNRMFWRCTLLTNLLSSYVLKSK